MSTTTKKIFEKATSIKTIVKRAKETKGEIVNFSPAPVSSCYITFNGIKSNTLISNNSLAV